MIFRKGIAMSKEPIEVSLDCEEIEYLLVSKSSGVKRTLILKEMDGVQRDKYLSVMSKRMKMIGTQSVITDYTGLYAMLLTQCLYEDGALLTTEQINKLPSRTQSTIFAAAQDLNGLTEESRTESKND